MFRIQIKTDPLHLPHEVPRCLPGWSNIIAEKSDPVPLPSVPGSHAAAPTWLQPWCRPWFLSLPSILCKANAAPHWGCAIRPNLCCQTGCQGTFTVLRKRVALMEASLGLASTGCGPLSNPCLPLPCFLQEAGHSRESCHRLHTFPRQDWFTRHLVQNDWWQLAQCWVTEYHCTKGRLEQVFNSSEKL